LTERTTKRQSQGNLHDRVRQNSAAEKLTSLWIDHLFAARLVQTV
jgi:hypothetical protein